MAVLNPTTNYWTSAPYFSIRKNGNYNVVGNTTKGELQEFNQWQGDEWDEVVREWALLDPNNWTDGLSGTDGNVSSHLGFNLLCVVPYKQVGANDEHTNAGEMRRVSIHDIISIGLSQFNDWTAVPALTVQPSGASMERNDDYDPDAPRSSTNSPTIWTDDGGSGGGLWVGPSHVITSITAFAETLGPDEEATADVTIDGEWGDSEITFGIPAGPKGDKGDDGLPGDFGPPGATPEINVGSVTEGPVPAVTLSPSSTIVNAVFDFVIPKGADGSDGLDSTKEGPPGPKGDTGADGSITTFFFTDQGADGLPGAQGDPGVAGPEGPQGLTGDDGLPGDELPGPKGDTGPTGPIGATSTVEGPKGDQGIQGITGIQGIQGGTGPMGPANPVAGPQGITGIQGPMGETGDTGPIGPQGIQGDKGNQGDASTEVGPKGDKGDTGDTGSQGLVGPASTEVGPAGATPEYRFLPANNTLYILNV